MRTRKGFIGSTLVDFYAYVLWVFVIIIFAIMFRFSGHMTQTISAEAADINLKTSLLNFVRAPVELDINNDNVKENITVGELIVFNELELIRVVDSKLLDLEIVITPGNTEKSEADILLEEKIEHLLSTVLEDDEKVCLSGIEIKKADKKKKMAYYNGELTSDVEKAMRQSRCFTTVDTAKIFVPVPEGHKGQIEVELETRGK